MFSLIRNRLLLSFLEIFIDRECFVWKTVVLLAEAFDHDHGDVKNCNWLLSMHKQMLDNDEIIIIDE